MADNSREGKEVKMSNWFQLTITALCTIGVSLLGYLVVEIRDLRNDFVNHQITHPSHALDASIQTLRTELEYHRHDKDGRLE